MRYIVQFNCAGTIAKMPKKRRDWERQLIDDFTRAIHRKQYLCESREDLIRRLEFIAGSGGRGISWKDEENHVKLDSTAYDERVLPVQMYGIAQGYVNFEKILEPLDHGKVSIFIKFRDFYDIRQRCLFDGCYVEVIRAA